MSKRRGSRYDLRADADRVREAEQAERDTERAILGSKRPPRHAIRAAEEFLRKRDPWDEIKPKGDA